jgi:hypothetical protein
VSVLRRLLVVACALVLLSAPAALAGPVDSPGAATSKKKGKQCKKGYKLKTVTKKGKKVKVCGKIKGKGKGAAPASPGQTGLFEAPGQKLEGEAAKPFLQKYLVNSRFTDCPAEWPNCAVEQRYSHAADNSFYYCRLTSTSGADIRTAGEYGVDNARVEPDGSWTFHEVVYAYGNYSEYEWRVATNGVVTGAYRFQPGSAIEQLGPLQYVSGARDCSY